MARSRREFLMSTAAAGSMVLLSPDEVLALLQNGVWVRPNVKNLTATSPDIVAYKAGIAAMRALPANNPLNWDRWANIHGSPSGTGPLWNTCQHGHWWFLPWHRMYLLFFERIIRKLSNTPSFALPFWDYTDTTQRALPPMFRTPTTNNPLYTANRNPGINTGSQLPSSVVNYSNAFTFTNFFGAPGSAASFGSQQIAAPNHSASPHGRLESTPHDSVHGAIGGWMGSFGTAARDPIFWLHHANIDRLWNLWLTQGGGRSDPQTSTWCNQTFSFFNENGVQVSMRVRDVINAQAQLKYRYEGEPPQVAQTCPPILNVTVNPNVDRIQPPLQINPRTLMSVVQATSLGASPTRMSMPLPAADMQRRAVAAIQDPKRSLVLRVEGIKVATHPGIVWEVYVGLAEGQRPDPAGPHFVGVLSTFGADHGAQHGGHGDGFTAAFAIDQAAARTLQGSPKRVGVTFVPRGLVRPDGRDEPLQVRGTVTFSAMRVIEE